MGNLFSAFGDAVSGDEKLSCYTGPSGYMHTLYMENGRTIACTDIVKCKETTLYMDSYYLTDEGRKWLRKKQEGRQEQNLQYCVQQKDEGECCVMLDKH
eukprot:4822218-Ditylum_brightwellii.AAC.1